MIRGLYLRLTPSKHEPMLSKTCPNAETFVMGFPSGPTKGSIETAADIIRLDSFMERSVCRKERKLAASFADTMLQPIPCFPGYSQLWLR